MHSFQKAFTLIELLASIAIMAALIAMSVVFIGDYVGSARRTSDQQTLTVLNDAITRYKGQGGYVPALTVGKPFPNLLSALATPVSWGGLSHQFLRTSDTISAQTVLAEGSGKTYRLTAFNNYTTTGSSGSSVPLTLTAKFVLTNNSWDGLNYSSVDGVSWELISLPESPDGWGRTVFGNGRFVVIDDYNLAAYSLDGVNWVASSLPQEGSWFSVIYGGGKFITIDYQTGQTAYSTDGVTWHASTVIASGYRMAPVYGAGKFLTIQPQTKSVSYSTDGVTWTTTTATMPYASTVPYWNGLWFAGNRFYIYAGWGDTDVISSTDGLNWTAESWLSDAWTNPVYGNGHYVRLNFSTNQYAYSTNGTSWTTASFAHSGTGSYLSFAGDKFFANSSGTYGAISSDGITWTETSTRGFWGFVYYGAGKYLSNDNDGSLSYSTNGINWTVANPDLGYNIFYNSPAYGQ